jgi:hypothetical protein
VKDSFITKVGIVAVVIVAFIDGMLVANHYHTNLNETQAIEGVELDDIFDSYIGDEVVEELIEEPRFIEIRDVPFTSQAPIGDWTSPWSDFAEEAVITMAIQWWKNEDILSTEQAEATMLDIARYEEEVFGDALLADLAQVQKILKDFFGISSIILDEPSISDITTALDEGSIVIAPVNGQILLNSHYGDPAPENHMVLMHGWEGTGFITHDPGTRHGESVNYEQEKILESIQDLDGALRILIIQL